MTAEADVSAGSGEVCKTDRDGRRVKEEIRRKKQRKEKRKRRRRRRRERGDGGRKQ